MLLSELINLKGINSNKIKLVRNTVNRGYIKNLMESGHFDLYQSVQKDSIFKDVEYIISFKEMQGTKALLYRVYRNNGVQMISNLPEELNLIKEPEKWGDGPYYKYNLEVIDFMDDLEERLIIE